MKKLSKFFTVSLTAMLLVMTAACGANGTGSGGSGLSNEKAKASDVAAANSIMTALQVYAFDPNAKAEDKLQDGATVTFKKGFQDLSGVCTGNADKVLHTCGIDKVGLIADWSDKEVNGIIIQVNIDTVNSKVTFEYTSNSDAMKEGYDLIKGEYK